MVEDVTQRPLGTLRGSAPDALLRCRHFVLCQECTHLILGRRGLCPHCSWTQEGGSHPHCLRAQQGSSNFPLSLGIDCLAPPGLLSDSSLTSSTSSLSRSNLLVLVDLLRGSLTTHEADSPLWSTGRAGTGGIAMSRSEVFPTLEPC